MRSRMPISSFQHGVMAFWLGHGAGQLQRMACVVACMAAASVLAWVALHWHTEQRALSEARERLQRQQVELTQHKPLSKPVTVALSSRDVTRHNAAVVQLNTPWSDIFDGLERCAQIEVGPTLLEPDTKKGTLRVQAEAEDVQSLLVYAQRLAGDPALGPLTLQQHDTNEQDSNRPARLSFELRLAAASAAEEAR